MENWRKTLYENYSSNKARKSQATKINCSFFKDKVQNLIPDNKSISIIDLAAGHGSLLHCLKKNGYQNIRGVDFSKEEVELGIKSGIKELFQDDIFEYLNKNNDTYNVIFLMDILEHLNRNEFFDLLSLVYKRLKQGGIIIVQVPNASGIFGMRIRYGDLTHETAFTYNSLLQGLTAMGFEMIKAIEVSPIKSGLKAYMRFCLWHLLVLPIRLILILETGIKKHILSQNIIIRAQKLKS